MRKTNYHTHTKRCMHACGKDEEYVLADMKNLVFLITLPGSMTLIMLPICACV